MITFNLKHLIFTVSFLLYSCSNNKELEEHRHKKLSDKIYEINIELSKQRTQIEELKAQLISFKDSLNKFDTKNDLDKLFLNVRNSVYLIRTTNNNNEVSLGSAFCISKDGIAISNHHVFENAAKSFAYNNNGSEFLITEIIEENKTFDYIIFRMGPLSKPLEFLPISYEYTKIGENVFTIGNPKGLEQTLSNGIVSGYRNNNLIQMTTEITNGSSGGPLLNEEGKVIGITTSGFGEANLNFAININSLSIDRFISDSTRVKDSIFTDVMLLRKMNDYYNNLKHENLNLVEKHYNLVLKRFHGLFSINKNIAIKDHKNYLSTYRIVKSQIVPSSIEIFRSQNEITFQYKLDYQIIERKGNISRDYILSGVVVINEVGKIISIYENILKEF